MPVSVCSKTRISLGLCIRQPPASSSNLKHPSFPLASTLLVLLYDATEHWNHRQERSRRNIRSTSYINRPRYKNVGDNKSRRKLKLGEKPYGSSILLHTAMAKTRGWTPRPWQKSY
ncbi:unnamed protein product [Fraxinus pennsylvanica]|uniref:Uncharacterized protein n=1 Tax=Fraxinus pennsylvanica TaxID=56036 RepID=A0AAD1Z1H5_9LAMI|nr:unnamed protein product [Fraxinus pennsylvanica]